MVSRGIDRRKALRTIGLAGAGAASLPLWARSLVDLAEAHAAVSTQTFSGPMADSFQDATQGVLNQAQFETVEVLTDLIIPQTDTAGARTARVTAFIDTILSDAEINARDQFVDGIGWIDQRSMELFGGSFLAATVAQQNALLTMLSARENKTPADAVGVEFFQALKSLTVTGYYTSRIGMLQELDDDGSNYFDEKQGCQHPEHKTGN